MNELDQDYENGRPPAKKNGTAVAVTVVGLMFGVAVLILLLVMRTNERGAGAQYPAGAKVETLSESAKKLPLQILPTEAIQKWVQTSLATSGKKIGVVNIWATWCAPCRDEMPELAKFQKTGDAPMLLVSADNELDEPVVRSFLSEMGVDFESVLIKGDQQSFIETWQQLSSKDPAKQWAMTLPATFIVNAKGEVLSFSIGTSTAKELQSLVKKTLDTLRD